MKTASSKWWRKWVFLTRAPSGFVKKVSTNFKTTLDALHLLAARKDFAASSV